MVTTPAPITATRTFAAPRLTYKSAAKAIEFYTKAFGAKETMRFEIETGIPHAELLIGDSVIMVTDEGRPVALKSCAGDIPITPADLESLKPACPPITPRW